MTQGKDLKWQKVTAWGETRSAQSVVFYPRSVEDCLGIMEQAKQKNLALCPRGKGYSVGDMILNEGHALVDFSGMNRIRKMDLTSGRLTAEPGVQIAQILQESLAGGWALGACPGVSQVSIGGCVSNNVHGKDSWKNGNFADQIEEIKVLTSRGEILTVSRLADPRVFRSVVAGMGLLGFILEVTIRLRPIPSPFLETTHCLARNLEELLNGMERLRETNDFVVAWVDAFATGAGLGRGSVLAARWIELKSSVNKTRLAHSLGEGRYAFGWVPADWAWNILRPFPKASLFRTANFLRYHLSRRGPLNRQKVLFSDFNFIHNKMPRLNHLFRLHGWLEFQPLVPRRCGREGLAHILKMCQRHQNQSLLCGIKIHRSDDPYLSYSGDGYSIGIVLSAKGRQRGELERFASELFGYTAEIGGRTFLAKDELLARAAFQKMFPAYEEFMRIKNEMDPSGLFASDMYRRLLA